MYEDYYLPTPSGKTLKRPQSLPAYYVITHKTLNPKTHRGLLYKES